MTVIKIVSVGIPGLSGDVTPEFIALAEQTVAAAQQASESASASESSSESASDSAQQAASSANAASTSESNAATSATNASNSASAAATSETNTTNTYNTFVAAQLKTWALSEAYTVLSATRNANNVVTSASVKWPDGTTGTFTATTINTTFNAIDAYTITYDSDPVKTITQSAVTRNSSGAVTAQPELTIS